MEIDGEIRMVEERARKNFDSRQLIPDLRDHLLQCCCQISRMIAMTTLVFTSLHMIVHP